MADPDIDSSDGLQRAEQAQAQSKALREQVARMAEAVAETEQEVARACTGSSLIRVAQWLPRPGSMPTGLRISRRRSEPRPHAYVELNPAEDRPSMGLSVAVLR
jgi:hypothetical protein